jgi:hypothetical protein
VGLFSLRAPGLRLVAEPGRGPRRLTADAAVASRGRRWE